MQLNDSVTLQPTNLKTSPFGQKEVRALVNYTTEKGNKKRQNVYVNWIDSIRKKTRKDYVLNNGIKKTETTYEVELVEIECK